MSKCFCGTVDGRVYTSTGEEALVSYIFSGHVCIDSEGVLIRWCYDRLEYYNADLKVWCGMVVSSVTYPLYTTTIHTTEDSAAEEEVKSQNFGVKHTKKKVRLARNNLHNKLVNAIDKFTGKAGEKGYFVTFADEAEVLIYLLAKTTCYGRFDLLDVMCGLEARYAEIKGNSLID